jgi:hypothetical protein
MGRKKIDPFEFQERLIEGLRFRLKQESIDDLFEDVTITKVDRPTYNNKGTLIVHMDAQKTYPKQDGCVQMKLRLVIRENGQLKMYQWGSYKDYDEGWLQAWLEQKITVFDEIEGKKRTVRPLVSPELQAYLRRHA